MSSLASMTDEELVEYGESIPVKYKRHKTYLQNDYYSELEAAKSKYEELMALVQKEVEKRIKEHKEKTNEQSILEDLVVPAPSREETGAAESQETTE